MVLRTRLLIENYLVDTNPPPRLPAHLSRNLKLSLSFISARVSKPRPLCSTTGKANPASRPHAQPLVISALKILNPDLSAPPQAKLIQQAALMPNPWSSPRSKF